MKRFLEPAVVRAIRVWLSRQEVQGERVNDEIASYTPIYVGKPKERVEDVSFVEEVRFRLTLDMLMQNEEGGYAASFRITGVARRILTPYTLPWVVSGTITPYN